MKHRRPVLTLECSVVDNFGERRFEVLVSLPGHDGIAVAEWPMRNAYLDAAQFSDMVSYVGSMMSSSIYANTGLQEVLPL